MDSFFDGTHGIRILSLSAVVPASNGARPSAGTMLAVKMQIRNLPIGDFESHF